MSSNFKTILVKLLKTVVPLAFGVLLFVFIFRTLNFKEIMAILKQDVNWWIIAISLPFGLGANIARAYRWELLVRPLGYKPKMYNMVYAVLGNYGVNLVFPRLGEIWRCTMIKQYEKIPFTKLLGTLITDRLADSLSVMLIMVFAFIMNIPYFNSFPTHFKAFLSEYYPDSLESIYKMYNMTYGVLTSVWLYIGIAAVVFLIWLIFFKFKHHGLVKKVNETLSSVWKGIKSIAEMKERKLFLLYTFLIWFGYFLYFYICFYAFPFTRDLGWNCGLIAFAMSSVAMGIPVQGGIGTWHLAVIAVLVGFRVDFPNAAAFALCVHTVQQFVFTAAFGLFGVVALPIANHRSGKTPVGAEGE